MLGLIAFALLGALVGSFIGVVQERVHTGQSFLKGRSTCNSCARTLGPSDLVPVLSWLLSLGRCRSCKSKVPAAYLLLEGSLALAFAAAYVAVGISPLLVALLSFATVLAFIVAYDLRHTIVPTYASNLLVVLGLLVALLSSADLNALGARLAVAGAIGSGFFLMYALSRGRAMGLGDAPVALALSLVAGELALAGLVYSFWIGALVGIFILVTRRGGPTMGIEVPFVPFLMLGYLAAFLLPWNPFVLL